MSIKLVASDLDGTLLLNGAMKLDDMSVDVINKITDMGILFAPASGRTAISLSKLFACVKNDLIYICENGALVRYKGENISKSPMRRDISIEIMKDIYSMPNCEVLISGENTAYLLPKSEAYVKRMREVVKNDVTIIKNFTDITEDVIKVSVCDMSGIANSREHFEKKWADKIQVAVSGQLYLDFNEIGVNKGMALKTIMDKFSINQEETAAFGDNYNDIELLSVAGNSYVMETAADEVKRYGKKVVSNVAKTLSTLYSL